MALYAAVVTNSAVLNIQKNLTILWDHCLDGTWGGTRTHTSVRTPDFESSMSTSSITQAIRDMGLIPILYTFLYKVVLLVNNSNVKSIDFWL